MQTALARKRILKVSMSIIVWLLGIIFEDWVKKILNPFFTQGNQIKISTYILVLTILFILFIIAITSYWKWKDTIMLNKQLIKDDMLFHRTQIDNLWEEHNKLSRQLHNTSELLKMINQTSGTTTRTIVSYINNLKTEGDIINAVEALYGSSTIPELQTIGLKGNIIHIMTARYHTEKSDEATAKIYFPESKIDNKLKDDEKPN